MCHANGKLRAASTGGHWEAASTSTADQEETDIKTGESTQFVNEYGTLKNQIKTIVKNECQQWLEQLRVNNQELQTICEQIELKNMVRTLTSDHAKTPETSANTLTSLATLNKTEEIQVTPDVSHSVIETNTIQHSELAHEDVQTTESNRFKQCHSNKLPNKLCHEFESYAELLQHNNVLRKVTFDDSNREMNIDVQILRGETETPITFLLDTGAQRSFISQHVYDQKLATSVKKQRSFIRLYGVSGQELTTSGEVELDIAIGEEIVRQKFIIANIKEEGILGFDFCQNHQAEWRWKDKELTLRTEFTKDQKETAKVARITTKEEVEVPARCEIITSGIIEHAHEAADIGIIEAQSCFLERYQIGVASVLARKTQNSIPVRLINTSEQNILIKKNTPLALYSPATILEEVNARVVQDETDTSSTPDLCHTFDDQLTVLDTSEQQKFRELIQTYQKQFMQSGGELGHTDIVAHEIHTGDHPPIKQRARREPIGMQGVVKAELEKMEKKNIIEPSSSPWGSPVVLVRKKDGTVRFCVDYRKLNSITKKDAYPLPRIEDNLDALRGSKLFSTLDLASGYWQVKMSDEHRHKTAFNTKYGLYQFKVMPFGLCNAPGTFERLMETVLRGMQWERAVLYLDDIIIFSQTVDEHLKRLQEVFERLKQANLTLKPSKCHFFQQEVEFLGHIVNQDGITTDPKKVEAVKNWEIPRRVKDVRAFLGLTGYYRRFIKDYGQIAKPLHELTEKDQPFLWTDTTHQAFETLKQKLLEAPILGYPSQDIEDMFILDTDASNCHVGGVLSQMQNGQEKVISYGSKVLSKSERNYCVTRRELLAVVHFCTQYKHYLIGRKFKLRTDHGALIWLFQFKEPEGQIARWLEILSEFQMEIIHRAGRIHSNGDAMSRQPCESSCPTCRKGEKVIEDVRCVRTRTKSTKKGRTARVREKIKLRQTEAAAMKWLTDAQKNDPHIHTIEQWKERPPWNEVKDKSEDIRFYWSRWQQIRKEGGIWQIKWRKNRKDTWRWIVPPSHAEQVVKDFHEDKLAGHFSIKKTIDALQRSPYYIAGLQEKVAKLIHTCVVCERTKPTLQHNRAPMKTCIADRPMQRIAVDVLGPLPESTKGNKYIIVVADYFTKWTEAYPVPDHQAKTIAQELVKNFFTRFGMPERIHSDQGRDFQSCLFKELCELLEIEKTTTTPWHPQSDGMVERFNRTIETLLRQCVEENQLDWDIQLPFCCAAYRSALHSTTGHTPNTMMLGRELPMPKHMLQQVPEKWVSTHTYTQELEKRMQDAHQLAAKHIKKHVSQYQRQYNKKSWQRVLKVNDWVWLNNFTKKSGLSPKLQVKWEDTPYRITQFLSEVVVEMVKFGSKKTRIVHINKVKRVGDQARWTQGDPTIKQSNKTKRPQFIVNPQGFPVDKRRVQPRRGTSRANVPL